MQTTLRPVQEPQLTINKSNIPAAGAFRTLTAALEARRRVVPQIFKQIYYPMTALATVLFAPTDSGIIQAVRQSRTLSKREKLEFEIYLNHR